MKREKRWLTGLAAALSLLAAGRARAATANTDSLTVTIIPNAGYSVVVTTTNVGLDLGVVNLGASTQTVRPSTITVTSSYATTGLKLTGSMSTNGGVPWTYAIDTSLQGSDQLAAWAVFTDTSVSDYTTLGSTGTGATYFLGTSSGAAGSNVVGTVTTPVGTSAGVSPHFIANSAQAGYKTMAALPSSAADLASSRAHMWMYFVLPPATTDNNAKYMTFTLSAAAPN
jgi:hypothetical protein